MDFNFKQWREQQQQHESEQQQQQTRLVLQQKCYHDNHEKQCEQKNQQEAASSVSVVLPLFVPQNPSIKSSDNLSPAYPHSSSNLPGMRGYLSLVQMQELELQALIYRHMVAGAVVPHDLLLLVKKSLLSSPHCFLQHNNTYPYYNPNWYWRRRAMDSEPGRCRRTDGKKWRCSRDVAAGHKYCERHVHRGRNSSRKAVESPTSTTSAATTAVSTLGTSSGTRFSLSGASAAIGIFQLNQGLPESKTDRKSSTKPRDEASGDDNAHDNRVLRSFFEDWHRSSDRTEDSPTPSTMPLSVSTPRNPSSDFLRLSTGSNVHEPEGRNPVNWWGGSSNHAVALGGPLAEALRSSTGSSPTSVLNQLQRGSASDTSFVTA